ncbi:response regulator transcription factor [Streptomyces sp. G44]|uniref:response regulator transcription factor n=1 Tax=Streptomyces sp. G44 TaxID=2807632 RepID=UPI0019600B85|nr:response regulator transcription factor [Streptomyces sp. G44]MBM7172720.1 response regulator transcription factor [Streptomyces sp. G44]
MTAHEAVAWTGAGPAQAPAEAAVRGTAPGGARRPRTFRVLICDQLPLMRDGLRTMLSATSDITVTGTADDRGTALDAADHTGPDVVLVGLPEPAEALDLVHRLVGAARRHGRPAPSFVVLYHECRSEDMAQLLAADVRGLIRRDATRSEVIDAIHRVVRGETAFSPEIVDRLRVWFLRKGAVAAEDTSGTADTLTQREREILVLIGRGSAPEDIAQSLFIGLTTVRTHIYRIRHKLSLKDRAQLVAYAYRTGLVERLTPFSEPLAS